MAEVRHSTCALDCPDACALLVNVEDGVATRLRGDPKHEVTRGFLCGKVARYLEREYHPRRLMHPLKRGGRKGHGEFARVSWDEALTDIAQRLQSIVSESGPEAVLPYSYAGTMGYLNGSGMDRRFFHRMGASRLDRTICSSAGGAGLMEALGCRLGMEPQSFAHSKLIIAWGANVLTTNVHLWPFIVEARRNGAKFYSIDPVKDRTAQLADRWYGIYPGSDMALALGLLHVIFREGLEDRDYIERYTEGIESLRARAAEYSPARVEQLTGILADDVIGLAREYATTRPASIRVNYGVQRSERGGRAMRAIALLPAVTGAWRDLGGGLQLTTSGAFQVNRQELERPDLQQIPIGREARLVNMSLLGQALTELADPPVKALIVYNSNPAAIAPRQSLVRQGLEREDLLTVVLEHFQTDTADYADYILPATTFLEQTDLYFAYGHYYLQLARPAVPPPGECRSNVEIFRELAKRMGYSDPCFDESEDEMIRGALNTDHPYLQGITLDRLDAEHSVRLNLGRDGEPFLPFATGGFGTPSGKCNLHADVIDYVPPEESRLGAAANGAYPLEMVSSKSHDSMNSTFGFRPATAAETAVVEIHPEDAVPRGIADGDLVELFNDRGRLRLTARVGETVRRGVVRPPSVPWAKGPLDGRSNSAAQGTPLNILTSDRVTDIGGGATFYNCLVEVRRCDS